MQVNHLSSSSQREKQSRIDGPDAFDGAHIDNQIDKGIEVGDGTAIANLGTLDAQSFGLTVDPLTSGALDVNRVIERTGAIHEEASAASRLIIEIFLAAMTFLELFVIAGLASGLRKEEWAAIALGGIAVGMSIAVGGMHPQANGATRNAIGIADGLGPSIEGNSGDPSMTNSRIIDVPGIVSGIGS